MTALARTQTRVAATTLLIALVLLALACATAGADYNVNACGQGYNEGVFSQVLPAGGSVLTAGSACPSSTDAGGFSLESSPSISASQGHRGAWQADAPAGLEITAASVPNQQITATNLNSGKDWGGGAYWAGGGQPINDNTHAGYWYGFASPYFGVQIVCGASPCKAGTAADVAALNIVSVALSVRETTGPSLSAPDGLWQTKGWVRGQWPLNFSGSSRSGMCGLSGTLDHLPVTGSSSPRDVAAWKQCAAPAVSDTINTAAYGSGAMPLYIAGYDAAGRTVSYTKTVYVDNSTPTVSMSGPTDASTTAGTQFVTAHAGGSPSGIDGISCTTDGGPARWYPGATARVAVSGVGGHQVSCTAFDNAVSAAGTRAASAPKSWSLKIGEPTELGVGFLKYVGLECHVVRKRVTSPGHWVIRHRHGKRVRIKTRPRHKIVKTTRCDPKVKRVRVVVRVPERRHGKVVRHHGHVVYHRKVEHKRVVVQPHWQSKTTQHVGHGRTTTVSGWLGLTDGTALGGHTVQILAAAANGLGQFSLVATTSTAANGAWSVKLPAGPSSVIKATYAGSPNTEPTTSGQIREIVPAKIRLQSVRPTRVAWGQMVTIKGRLLGGYLPPGGVNVRLRLGRKGGETTYGVKEHVAGDGRFRTTYTFGAGLASEHYTYWFQIATLPEGNYPYSPSHSGRIYVTVGGHPKHRHPHGSSAAAPRTGAGR